MEKPMEKRSPPRSAMAEGSISQDGKADGKSQSLSMNSYRFE
jgi:hypothetical protein